MNKRELTNEEVDKILELLGEGKTVDEIREELGIPSYIRYMGTLIPRERKEEYQRARELAWKRRKRMQKAGKSSETSAISEAREHRAEREPESDVLQEVAKRPSPKSEIVRDESQKAEKVDWWKYVSIGLGIIVLGGIFLLVLAQRPSRDPGRKPRSKRNSEDRESGRARYRALADKYKVV